LPPGARLRGDVCTNFAAVLVRRGPRWGYVIGGDAGGLWEVASRDHASISGLCPGRFELSVTNVPGSPDLPERHSGFVRARIVSKPGFDLLRLVPTTCLPRSGAM